MEKEFKGVWIPADIFLIEGLTLQEKLLIITIIGLDNGEGCFAGNDYLAKFIQVSKSTCSNFISKLKDKGIIYEPKEFDGRKRYIAIDKKLLYSLPLINTEAAFEKQLSSLSNIIKQPLKIAKADSEILEGSHTNIKKQPLKNSDHINIDNNIDINIPTNIINKENAELENSTPKPEKKKKEKVEDCEYYFEFHQVISYLSNKTGATYRIPESLPKFLKYQPYILIKTLFKENYNYEQINKVINDKCDEWLNDPKMCVYLKPDTLFRKSNFEKYLIAIEIKLKNKPKPQIQTYNNDKPKYVPKPLIIKSV